MEIITGAERRRRWRLEEKLRIVAEVEQPGASIADCRAPARGKPEAAVELAWSGPTWRVGAGADADVPANADHGGSAGSGADTHTGSVSSC